MEQAGVIGFMLVIFLFPIGLSNDIGRLTGGGSTPARLRWLQVGSELAT